MDLNMLTAISPIDGRYRSKASGLAVYFSEYALIQYRVRIEVEYFLALLEIDLYPLRDFPRDKSDALRRLYRHFTEADAQRIKAIERTTNHDVKAVEYFLKEAFTDLGIAAWAEFIHFGLTSQDVNNTAIPLALVEFLEGEYLPQFRYLQAQLSALAEAWAHIPMLARTHGQPASPTRLGKEMQVFASRLEEQIRQLESAAVSAKFGGATGNLNAHYVAFPHIDWHGFATQFVERLHAGGKLLRSPYTTQIDTYDVLGACLDNLKRINVLLIDFAQDVWLYVMLDYFKQAVKAGEIGSSAMPHKVNPIDFENAEGNLGVANALLEFMSRKLPVSRLQRDLTDSTVLRNLGVPLAHAMVACESLLRGLGKLSVNEAKIQADLADNWAVVAEALQTILRREGYPQPYEALKALTRTGDKITPEAIASFIDTLEVSELIKIELRAVSPFNYVGK